MYCTCIQTESNQRRTTIVLSEFIRAEYESHFWKEVHTQSSAARNGISLLWSSVLAKARNISPCQNTIYCDGQINSKFTKFPWSVYISYISLTIKINLIEKQRH